MCGIFGAYTEHKTTGLPVKYIKAIRDMIWAGQVRGRHGAGMFSIYPTKKDGPLESTWVKTGGPVEDLIRFKETEGFMDNADKKGVALVGHHRFATQGEHSTANAHPFNIDHITLVHNGFIQGMPMGEKARPDSFYFTEKLAKAGKNWRDIIAETWGAYSLVWFDAEDQKLRFLRNHARPMAFAKSKDVGFLFASELPMLKWIADRNEVIYESIHETQEGMLYELDLKSGEMEVSEKPKKDYGAQWVEWKNRQDNNTQHVSSIGQNLRSLQQQVRQSSLQTSGKGSSDTKMKCYKTYQNLVVGDAVLFSLTDMWKVGKDVSKQTQYHYEGLLESVNPNKQLWEVHFMLSENRPDLASEPVLQGEVVNIVANKFGDQVQVWVKGKSVEPFKQDQPAIAETYEMYPYVKMQEDPDSDDLVLFDGKTITQRDWEVQASKGCVECGTTMFKHNADHCVQTQSGIICQDCVDNFTSSKRIQNAEH